MCFCVIKKKSSSHRDRNVNFYIHRNERESLVYKLFSPYDFGWAKWKHFNFFFNTEKSTFTILFLPCTHRFIKNYHSDNSACKRKKLIQLQCFCKLITFRERAYGRWVYFNWIGTWKVKKSFQIPSFQGRKSTQWCHIHMKVHLNARLKDWQKK